MEAILEEFWEDVDFSWTWRYQLDNVMAIHDQDRLKPAGLIQRQILYLSLIMWSAREIERWCVEYSVQELLNFVHHVYKIPGTSVRRNSAFNAMSYVGDFGILPKKKYPFVGEGQRVYWNKCIQISYAIKAMGMLC